MPTAAFNDILEDINFFDDWEERYSYIIDLGKRLADFPKEKTDEDIVDGCVSQVWLTCKAEGEHLHFWGDSDAFIVKGLIAILLSLYNEQTAEDILAINAASAFQQLGLEQHISPNRRNGFFSMVGRIQLFAMAHKVH